MKEATGELNMTVITIIAIAAIAGLFALLWPNIQKGIKGEWNAAGDAAHKANGTTNKSKVSVS